jgi:short-subunit dehydrogenase
MMSKVILVTGASSGIGKETVKLLRQKGHMVYAGARGVEKMNDLKKLGIQTVKMDVTKEEENKAVIDQIMSECGKIDVLINNAGFGLFGPVEDIPMKDARYQFDVNIFGLAHLVQLVIPHMRKQHSGRIINLSSVGGKIYSPLGSWYYATKHALEGWSDCLRLELKPMNIQVVLIEPGYIKTNFGNIMQNKLIQYAENKAYKPLADPYIKFFSHPKTAQMGTAPIILAREIVKAVEAKKPKTRYMKGFIAKPSKFIRVYLGDRLFDAFVKIMLH